MYSSTISIPINFRPYFNATIPVVLRPQKGSKIISPKSLPDKIHLSTSFSGKAAMCLSPDAFVGIVQTDLGFFNLHFLTL